jgi:hypothetical protein
MQARLPRQSIWGGMHPSCNGGAQGVTSKYENEAASKAMIEYARFFNVGN